MTTMKFAQGYWVLTSLAFGMAAPAFAQEAAPASSHAPAATPALTPAPTDQVNTAGPAADKPAGPSPELLKQARMAGYKAKLRKGVKIFCREDASTGSHLSSEKCVDENALASVLGQTTVLQDQMRKSGACTGSACLGK